MKKMVSKKFKNKKIEAKPRNIGEGISKMAKNDKNRNFAIVRWLQKFTNFFSIVFLTKIHGN
jgi:hypothetical protein